jgi:hypothetical protein
MTQHSSGRCLCGTVSFRARGPFRGIVYCHCTQCRRQTGHYFASTQVPDDQIEIEGSEMLRWYHASPEARRGFCSRCGSVLFWKRDGSDRISILAGSFDRPSGLRAAAHIYVADKGDYYEIDDGLPQFAQEAES